MCVSTVVVLQSTRAMRSGFFVKMVISCDPAALVRSRGIVVYQAHKLQVIAFHMHRQLCRMWQLHEHWLNSVPEFNRILCTFVCYHDKLSLIQI